MRSHAAAAHRVETHRQHHRRHAAHAIHRPVNRFLGLPLGVAIALVWANTVPEPYFRLAQTLAFGVNEIGMALFVGLIMQEIVEATMEGGALHSWRRWTLPLIAAAGGIAGSAGTYLAYVQGRYEVILTTGWPIACAIDVAAAYYVLKAIMPRSGILPFALLLGIATDLFGMVIVAVWHPVVAAPEGGIALLLVALGLAGFMRTLKIRAFWPYLLICGPLSWLAFLRDGLHPAFALVPIVPFLPHEPRQLDLLADPPDDDAVHHFEHEWNTLVQVVLFLFGLVNGGVILTGYDTGTWAVLLAALVGRPAGILAAIGVAVLAGWHLPRRIGWRQLLVAAYATSTGLTFALFFASGILYTGPMLAQLTIGALATAAGSALAIGIARLARVGRFSRAS